MHFVGEKKIQVNNFFNLGRFIYFLCLLTLLVVIHELGLPGNRRQRKLGKVGFKKLNLILLQYMTCISYSKNDSL